MHAKLATESASFKKDGRLVDVDGLGGAIRASIEVLEKSIELLKDLALNLAGSDGEDAKPSVWRGGASL